MPHLTLEYSANVAPREDLKSLFAHFHRILAEVGGIRIDNCKSRAHACDSYLVARGEPSGAFVHLDVRFLEGRPAEAKSAVGKALLEALRRAFPESTSEDGLQLTVEVRDIAQASYFKHPEGTLTSQR